MQKIVTHLWYDKEADEAARFYTSLFEDSEIENVTKISDTPSGTSELITISLSGTKFMLISAGPFFRLNPSISIRVDCETAEEVDRLCGRLSEGGSFLMPLDSYPFSGRYAWVQDRFGVSWQIMLTGKVDTGKKFTPTLMFTGDHCGQAEEAIRFYSSVFGNSGVDGIMYYGDNEEPDAPGTVKHASFTLEGQPFAAMDSAYQHEFTFNEAVSLVVNCSNQEEIDYFWEKLSFVPEAEQCGWLKDRFGVSWQIVPEIMGSMMETGDPEQLKRVTQAFLKMKKFDIAELQRAYDGDPEKLYPYTLSDEKTVEIFLNDDNCTIGHVILKPGDALPEHSTDSNVYLLVVRGELTLSMNKNKIRNFSRGAVANVPFGILLGMSNSSGEVMELFAFKSPNPRNYGK
jgi:predicted 3-demethylubiquinone-9 3-methyltransferase (glyoxalase superfamily)/quercetin dioxygenase-like cupin family protein